MYFGGSGSGTTSRQRNGSGLRRQGTHTIAHMYSEGSGPVVHAQMVPGCATAECSMMTAMTR